MSGRWRTWVNKLGLHCEIANDGQEAVDAASQKRFDLIFMDCNMPIMDGYQATAIIQSDTINRETPIIALTADISANEKDGIKLFNDILLKPFKRDNLVRIIKKHLQVQK